MTVAPGSNCSAKTPGSGDSRVKPIFSLIKICHLKIGLTHRRFPLDLHPYFLHEVAPSTPIVRRLADSPTFCNNCYLLKVGTRRPRSGETQPHIHNFVVFAHVPCLQSLYHNEHTRRDFDAIKRTLTDSFRGSAQTALLAEGDSLSLLRNLPKHCVSLILTDPPYHTTKKKNIYGDTRFKEDERYLDWMRAYAEEWKRVLRPNGSLLCFCASEMSARLELLLAVEFNILSQIVWTKPNEPGFDGWKQKMKKESLRQWNAHTERIVFAEPACEGNLMRSPFGNFLKTVRKKAGAEYV